MCMYISRSVDLGLDGPSQDKTIKVWDLSSGTCKASMDGHRGDVLAVCKINASTVATASGDKDVRTLVRIQSWL